MSPFNRLDRIASRVCDRQFANSFTCTPMLSTPNGSPQPDPERAPWTGKGILDEEPAHATIEIGGRNRSDNDLRTLVSGRSIELSVDCSRHLDANQMRQGDLIEMSGRTFEVSEVRRDGMSRIVFWLHEA